MDRICLTVLNFNVYKQQPMYIHLYSTRHLNWPLDAPFLTVESCSWRLTKAEIDRFLKCNFNFLNLL